MEQGRVGLIPDRNHGKHPALQGRNRAATGTENPGFRATGKIISKNSNKCIFTERDRQMDRNRGTRIRHPGDIDR